MSELPVIVLGSIGNCLDIVEAMQEHNRAGRLPAYRPLGFLDDSPSAQASQPLGLPVLGFLADAQRFPEASFVLGIGSPRSFKNRPDLLEGLGLPPERFVTVIHPSASISTSSQIGRGCIILQQVTVAAQARLGDHVTVLPQSVISHDSAVEDYSILAGGVMVCGGVQVGRNCYLGAHSTLHQGLSLGQRVLVGMGSVVLRDVSDDTVVYGNPARPRG